MKENVLIKSSYNKKTFLWVTLLRIPLVIAIFLSFIKAGADKQNATEFWIASEKIGIYGPKPKITDFSSFWLLMFLVLVFVASLFLTKFAKKCSITVTDKRIFGNASFGKRVDLPLDSVSATGTVMFSGVVVSTSSGAIKFIAIKNQEEILETINNLIINRQNKYNSKPEIVVSNNADELKKYKELFDAGVITQEEFETKKKQILGL